MLLKEIELTRRMGAPVALQSLNDSHDYSATRCRLKLSNRLPLHLLRLEILSTARPHLFTFVLYPTPQRYCLSRYYTMRYSHLSLSSPVAVVVATTAVLKATKLR